MQVVPWLNLLPFMEATDSVPCSQASTTGSCGAPLNSFHIHVPVFILMTAITLPVETVPDVPA